MNQPASDLQYAFLAVLAKSNLRQGKWTYRTAAEVLGRSYQHLSDVLNGHRQSLSLLRHIIALPARDSGFIGSAPVKLTHVLTYR